MSVLPNRWSRPRRPSRSGGRGGAALAAVLCALAAACGDGGPGSYSSPPPTAPPPPVPPGPIVTPSPALCFRTPLDGARRGDGCLDFLRPNPNRGNQRHVGDDLCAPAGTTVHAAAAGLVVFAQPIEDCPNWGHLVLVEHRLPEGGRMVTLYGHILPAVAEGAAVEAGEPLGSVHHYDCWRDHLHLAVALRDYGAPVGQYADWVLGYLRRESDPVLPWTDPLPWIESRPAC